MTTEEHDAKAMADTGYRDLYMKYLGCLRTMADAAVHLNGNDSASEFDLAFDDAEETFPHLRVKRILNGRELKITR